MIILNKFSFKKSSQNKAMWIYILLIASLVSCGGSPVIKKTSEVKAPFDGQKFSNLEPFQDKKLFDILKWRFGSIATSWPEYKEQKTYKPFSKRSAELQVSVVNHSTVLIQVDNLNILTDPVYSNRTSPISFIGPKRVRNAGIKFEDLPPIDIVLISHNHYDHLDLETLKKLDEKFSPVFLVGLGNKKLLDSAGIKNTIDMDWWDEHKVSGLKFHFTPSQHWSARGILDRFETLWGGFYIEASKNIYFAGDTGYGEFFKNIKDKYGAPELALLPIGAYEPRWFMRWAHMNPEDAVKAFIDLEAGSALGIHFGTFQLTDEGINKPVEDLADSLTKHKVDKARFIAPEFGKFYNKF